MKLIRPARVAELRGVHVDTVARWVRLGLLKPALLTAGGHARFDEDAIVAWSPPRSVRQHEPPPPRPWRPRRVWPTNAKGQKPLGSGSVTPAPPQISEKLFEARLEEHRRNPPQYYQLLPGEADWRAKRRSAEYAARRRAEWSEGKIIFGQMTRRQLYDAIWREPLLTVARRHGMSDNGLRKICKNYKIPMPKRGHWATRRSRSSKQNRRKLLPG